jgi:hypothetical protein
MPFPLFLSSERSRMRATWLRIPRDGSWLTQSVVVSLWSLIPPIQVLHVHNSWFHSKSAIINVIMSTTQLYSCHDILISSYFMSPCLKYWYSHPPNFPYKYSPICPISPKKQAIMFFDLILRLPPAIQIQQVIATTSFCCGFCCGSCKSQLRAKLFFMESSVMVETLSLLLNFGAS